MERRERPPTDGARRQTSNRLIGSYLAQEGAIGRMYGKQFVTDRNTEAMMLRQDFTVLMGHP